MIKIIFLLITIVKLISSTTVDPWYFEQRNGLYQDILNSTIIPSIFGDDELGNILHGLPLQLHWQGESGRLNLTVDSTGQHRIDVFSWWAQMNYFLSVIPYLAAMEVGLVPQVTILPPTEGPIDSFCFTFQECDQSVMANWKVYFDLVVEIQNSPSTNYTSAQMLHYMWIAHTGSIKYAKAMFPIIFNVKEAKFGAGWASFVEILSIVNFNTNYTDVSTMEVALPPRVLIPSDVPPFISDFTKDQNNIVASIFACADIAKSSLSWNALIKSLEFITSNPKCDYYINKEISAYIQKPIKTIIQIIGEAVIFCKNA